MAKNILKDMEHKAVEFDFTKANGETRHARGTRNADLIAQAGGRMPEKGFYKRGSAEPYFDLDVKEIRSFDSNSVQ